MLEVIFTIIIFAAILSVSWISTVGIIKLITICFGWSFSWATATGIWLILELARLVISAAKSSDRKE